MVFVHRKNLVNYKIIIEKDNETNENMKNLCKLSEFIEIGQYFIPPIFLLLKYENLTFIPSRKLYRKVLKGHVEVECQF